MQDCHLRKEPSAACGGSENQTTGLRPMEMHPYPRLRRYFPRRGKSALLSAFGLIQCEQHFCELAAIAATPYPVAPDFSTGKRLTWFSGRFAPLRTKFACHPYSGGRINRSTFTFSIMWHNAEYP